MKDTVSLAMGSGGRAYHRLIQEYFLPAFGNPMLNRLTDSALCRISGDQLALTTDSFVVQPRFFPGGDIGRLAVCGTVNDLAMSGAIPHYLTCSMIIEAGFSLDELQRICFSMATAAAEAGVQIVTGDTKVVEHGACDGLFINTAGVGLFSEQRQPLPQKLLPGDLLLVSGSIGDHGLAIMAARENLRFSPQIESDAAPLNGLVDALLAAAPQTHALRDATRGGVAAVCNEWAEESSCHIELLQASLPIKNTVQSGCDLLGLEPLYLANEGKLLAAIPAEQAEAALAALHAHALGKDAAIIGRVEKAAAPLVTLRAHYGISRIIDMPEGELLPRIC